MKRRLEQEAMEAEKNELVYRGKKQCSKKQPEERSKKQKRNEKPVEIQMEKDEIQAMELERNEIVNEEVKLRMNQPEEQRKEKEQNEVPREIQMEEDEIEIIKTGRNEMGNEDLELCINQLEDQKKKEKQNEDPIEGQMLKEEIQADENQPQLNGGEKQLNELVNNLLERYDSSRQQKLKKIMKIVNEQLFEEKHTEIKGHFKFSKRNYLFVDNLSNETIPDFIDSALSEFDNDVEIRHHWNRSKCHPSVWVGAVAVFKTPEKAMEVRIQLKDSKYITVVPMQGVLDILIKAEIQYPKSKEKPTVVYIRGKNSFLPSKENLIWPTFERFGEVTDIKIITVATSGLIARVSYKYASHALVAKFLMDQCMLMEVGTVSAEVIMTPKERSLLDYMRHYIKEKFTYEP